MEQKIRQSRLIGENIKNVRMSNEMTQEQLATKLQLIGCDISRGTLAKIEAGIRHLSADELRYFKKALEVSYDDFFEENK